MSGIIVTETSDPVLWGKLMTSWNAANQPGWVLEGTTHFKVIQATDDDIEFHERESLELLDSRSVIGSRPASYSELE